MSSPNDVRVPVHEDAFLLDEFLPHELSVTATRSSRLLGRRLEAAFGLSIAEWRVLVVVARLGTTTPSTVAERTDMDKVKVSRATASLVAANLLQQGPSPHDGRARLLSLTRKGQDVHDEALPMAREMEGQIATGVSEGEWRSLRSILRRLQAHMRTLEETAARQLPRQHLQEGPFAAEA